MQTSRIRYGLTKTQPPFSREEKVSRGNLKKGVETGNYYYGARYYNPKISVWLSVDPLAHKYPSLSPYVFTGNNPIMLVDPDGKEIYIVDAAGKATLVTAENFKSLSLGVNMEGLFATSSGAEVLNTYMNNDDHDVYITVGQLSGSAKGKTRNIGRLPSDLSGPSGSPQLSVKDGKMTLDTKKWADDGIQNFDVLDLTSSAGKKISLIVIHPNSVAKYESDGALYEPAIAGIEVLFHELNAHIKNHVGNMDTEHLNYGAEDGIFQNSKLDPSTPVGVFTRELSESKLKIIDHTRETLKNKVIE